MSRTVRSLAVLALLVWFLAGTIPASAAPLFGPSPEPSVWSAAWEWLVGLFAPAGGTIDPNGEAGAIDPNGKPERPGGATTNDAGVAIDPNG